MTRGLRIVIFSTSVRSANGGSTDRGLSQDSKLIEHALRLANTSGFVDTIESIDPISFYGNGQKKPQPADIQIHLEIPCRAAFPWAKYNIVVVNPEWWSESAWNWATAPSGGADMFVFKSRAARALFPEISEERASIIHWASSATTSAASASLTKRREFLYLIGASVHKVAAAKVVCKAWKSFSDKSFSDKSDISDCDSDISDISNRTVWPALHIVGATGVIAELQKSFSAVSNIVFHTSYTEQERLFAQKTYAYHVVASTAEGYGLTFAEAATLGGLPLWTDIPVYKETWGKTLGTVGCIETEEGTSEGTSEGKSEGTSEGTSESSEGYREKERTLSVSAVRDAVDSLLRLSTKEETRLRSLLRSTAEDHKTEFRHGWRGLFQKVKSCVSTRMYPSIPPTKIAPQDLPHVAVITVTRNRPRWFGNMARNILLAEYPPEKLTWILADDGDVLKGGMCDAQVAKFQEKNPHISVKYIPMSSTKTIGEKRNKACSVAEAKTSVFVMMDDDDHYPSMSIALRVAWLSAMGTECVYCSTLPMYDCTRYISAMNVPPLDLAPCERVSEATLCFTRNFWESHKFPSVSMAEGSGFLAGREAAASEIPPEGIIVSFIHGRNVSSRRVPQESEPNGCHYGFDDAYFTYISELGLVE